MAGCYSSLVVGRNSLQRRVSMLAIWENDINVGLLT
jgi:hypothetical protein